MKNQEDQIILVDKPAGMSSFGAVARVRGRLKAEFGKKIKVGHTGTLDPFATGLLILLSGKNTKRSNEFLKLDKVYEATAQLGMVSTTGDPEGEITEYRAEIELGNSISNNGEVDGAGIDGNNKIGELIAAAPSLSDVEKCLEKFMGEIEQTVPKFSAIKINGERAYKLARAGKDFELPTRKVTIYDIEIIEYAYPKLRFRAHVSSGTYIRTLAEDIGKALGVGAYLLELRRTKIGDFDVKDAIIKLC